MSHYEEIQLVCFAVISICVPLLAVTVLAMVRERLL